MRIQVCCNFTPPRIIVDGMVLKAGEEVCVTELHESRVIVIDYPPSPTATLPLDQGAPLHTPMPRKPTNTVAKPPQGLRPRYVTDAERLQEIEAAVKRYKVGGQPIPKEWVEEYKLLLSADSQRCIKALLKDAMVEGEDW